MTDSLDKVYLCFPFTHKFFIVRWWRFYKSTRLTARILKLNPELCIFSPITHSFPVSLFLGNSTDGKFWLNQDFSLLDNWADIMLIPIEEESWRDSHGIKAELERFNGKVKFVLNNGQIIDNWLDALELEW